MRRIKFVLTVIAAALLARQSPAVGKAARVVLMVWDGMRPDFVSAATTPILFSNAQNGVIFLHHHPVYPSMTEVNAVALATGDYPERSGIIGNSEFRPDIDVSRPVPTDSIQTARRGDELTGNHYIAFPTVSEILHEHGLRTAVAGTKPVALLHDRGPRTENFLGADVFAGNALPEALKNTLAQELGKFPEVGSNKINLDQWTTRALIGPLWRKEAPVFSVLWMAEPDWSQHQTGPGSPASLAAIHGSDSDLGMVLDSLAQKKLLDSTDVIVVSDHGFSTIKESVEVTASLTTNGFRAFRKFPTTGATPGDIMVVPNAGEISCYVTGHDPALVERLAHFFMAQPFSSVIFTRKAIDGTFPLSGAGIDSSNVPDLMATMRWTLDKSQYGIPDMIYATGGWLGPGQGQHATLGPSDMHNFCVAFGPDFRKGFQDTQASGNVDIAPTILWILGIEPKDAMSGRVLSEALTIAGPAIKSSATQRHETEWKGNGFLWRQYLQTSEVNGVKYIDEGNGRQETP